MRIHPVNFLIALLVSGLLTYGLASVDANTLKGTTSVGGFLFLACTLVAAIGLEFARERTGVNVRVIASLAFVVALALQLVFSFGVFSQASYVIVNGIAFCSFVLVANAIYAAGQ